MPWTLSALSVVVLVTAAVAIVVAVAAWRERPDPLALPLTILMVAVAAWAVPHAISFGFTDVDMVSFFTRLQYFGIVVAPTAYLVFSLRYAGYERLLTTRVYALLAVVPILTVIVVWTNAHHGWFWEGVSAAVVLGATILDPVYGPWYWINLGYLYLVTITALTVLGLVAYRSGPIYRKQAMAMFAAGVIPLSVNGLVNFTDVAALEVDLTTTALALSGILSAVALFHLDLISVRPVARDRVIDELDDGVVVVGPAGRIRDFNPTASAILGAVHINQPFEEVLPSDVLPDGGELVAVVDGMERRFRARSSDLTDGRGRTVGHIVYLTDVTSMVEREQRVSVLNRILRHNIRNESTVILGRLEGLTERVDEVSADDIEIARGSTERILDFAEKARLIERMIREGGSPVAVPAASVAERVLSTIGEEHPDVALSAAVTGPDGDEVEVLVVDERLFAIALTELVENAIEHNTAEEPRVDVRISDEGAWVRVQVIDNGPGMPDAELAVVTTAVETPLDHSSGIGLWLVKWFVSLSDGRLSIDENEPRGSVLTMSLRSGASGGPSS